MSKGYHIATINKGSLGDLSKIQEELDELKDAEAQGIRIMQLVELSDLVGAIEAYLNQHFPGMSMSDLSSMAFATKRAFQNGFRK